MKVMVTGGAGFVGSHVCDLLMDRGDEVLAVDQLLTQIHPDGDWPSYLYVHRQQSDIYDLTEDDFDGFDAVIHLAARVGVGQSMNMPWAYMDSNASQTAHLLQAMAKARPRLVIASSMSVYGEGSRQHGVPEDWPRRPNSVYATSKLAAEQVAMQLADFHEIECVALRYFNIYGPRQQVSNPYTGLGAIFTRQISEGTRPTVFEDGEQLRDFVHVSDVAEATVQAIDAAPDVYNIGTGVPTSVMEFAQMLCEAHDTDLEPELTGQTRKGDIRYCWADITHARESFGYEPQVELQDGIDAFVA